MNVSSHSSTTNLRRRSAVAGVAVFLVTALGAFDVDAQAGGAKPIRVIVPFAAGSYTDNVLRIVLPALGEKLGATIVVENRPGANGLIGADAVAKSPPDGYTFLMGGTSVNAANPGLYKQLPYDPVKDLVPVSRFGVLPFLLVVNPKVAVKTVPELIDHAKKNPGKLAYATPNSATLVGHGNVQARRRCRHSVRSVQVEPAGHARPRRRTGAGADRGLRDGDAARRRRATHGSSPRRWRAARRCCPTCRPSAKR